MWNIIKYNTFNRIIGSKGLCMHGLWVGPVTEDFDPNHIIQPSTWYEINTIVKDDQLYVCFNVSESKYNAYDAIKHLQLGYRTVDHYLPGGNPGEIKLGVIITIMQNGNQLDFKNTNYIHPNNNYVIKITDAFYCNSVKCELIPNGDIFMTHYQSTDYQLINIHDASNYNDAIIDNISAKYYLDEHVLTRDNNRFYNTTLIQSEGNNR